jgi:hypothetical protein
LEGGFVGWVVVGALTAVTTFAHKSKGQTYTDDQ